MKSTVNKEKFLKSELLDNISWINAKTSVLNNIFAVTNYQKHLTDDTQCINQCLTHT